MASVTAGRHSEYTPEKATVICEQLSQGTSLRQICTAEDMPDKATVMRWLQANDEFRDQYARAREYQAEHWAEEIVEIADDGTQDTYRDEEGNERTNHELVQRSRLRVDTRKWLMARMAPKKYGDRVVQEHTGKDGAAIEFKGDGSDYGLARRIAFLLTSAAPKED